MTATRSDRVRGDMYFAAETTIYGDTFRLDCTVDVYGPTAAAETLATFIADFGLTGAFEPIDGGVVGTLELPLEGGVELVRIIQLDGYLQLELKWIIW